MSDIMFKAILVGALAAVCWELATHEHRAIQHWCVSQVGSNIRVVPADSPEECEPPRKPKREEGIYL